MHVRFAVIILLLSSVKTLQNFLYQTLSPISKSNLYCKNDDKTYTFKKYLLQLVISVLWARCTNHFLHFHVCLSVFLSVCLLATLLKSNERITVKNYGGVPGGNMVIRFW